MSSQYATPNLTSITRTSGSLVALFTSTDTLTQSPAQVVFRFVGNATIYVSSSITSLGSGSYRAVANLLTTTVLPSTSMQISMNPSTGIAASASSNIVTVSGSVSIQSTAVATTPTALTVRVFTNYVSGDVTVTMTDPSGNTEQKIITYPTTSPTTTDLQFTGLVAGTPYTFTATDGTLSATAVTLRASISTPVLSSVTIMNGTLEILFTSADALTQPPHIVGLSAVGYTPTTSYSSISIVSLGGNSYKAIANNTANLPAGTTVRISIRRTSNPNASIVSGNVTILPQPDITLTQNDISTNSVTVGITTANITGDITLSVSGASSVSPITVSSPYDPVVISGLLADSSYNIVASYGGSDLYTLSIRTAAELANPVPCFFGNARVLTPDGYKRISSLRAGDKVTTPSGEMATIEAVKLTLVEASKETNPYVIEAGQFGCTKKLLISPEHNVATSRGLVKARDLGLKQETHEGTLEYYNLRLAGEAQMVVQGVPVESLAHVERIVMSRAEFERRVVAKYGRITPAIHAMIARTCRFLDGDRVECPAMRR